jgi:hypothetical protein
VLDLTTATKNEISSWHTTKNDKIEMKRGIRNLCDHNKKQEPTSDQVNDLIDGTAKVLKTIA